MTHTRKLGFVSSFAIAVALVLTLGGTSAFADTTSFDLTVANAGGVGFTGPFEHVNIDLNAAGTIATVTFTALTSPGGAPNYVYLMSDGGTVDLNVNGTYTLGTVTELNTLGTGFTPTYSSNTPGQVDGFGTFNLSLNNSDGFPDGASSVSFTLTKLIGTWSSAANVLTPNAGGSTAAAHTFACKVTCTEGEGAAATFFVANGSQVPEPKTISLLAALAGLMAIVFGFRRRNAQGDAV